MTIAQLEYAEKRMQQKWHDLVMAEQQGAAIPVLERMYNSYMLMVEEYNRCSREYQPTQGQQPSHSSLVKRPRRQQTQPLDVPKRARAS